MAATSFPKLTLVYFDFRGRAEIARLALWIGNVPFEDKRISFPEWGALKPSTPFGQLPYLVVNDKDYIAQSAAIFRYVGALGGLYPASDPFKAALVDQIGCHLGDISEIVVATMREKDEEKKMEARSVIAREKHPAMFAALEKVLEQHGGKWAVGDDLSISDLGIYHVIRTFKSGLWDGIPVETADGYPKVMAIYEAVKNHPKVVEWEAAHPAK